MPVYSNSIEDRYALCEFEIEETAGGYPAFFIKTKSYVNHRLKSSISSQRHEMCYFFRQHRTKMNDRLSFYLSVDPGASLHHDIVSSLFKVFFADGEMVGTDVGRTHECLWRMKSILTKSEGKLIYLVKRVSYDCLSWQIL
jgi:hypothetical protein